MNDAPKIRLPEWCPRWAAYAAGALGAGVVLYVFRGIVAAVVASVTAALVVKLLDRRSR